MRSINIGHISDLHYSEQNLKEADKCVGFSVDKSIEENVDVFFITGDSIDHRLDAHSPALMALMRRVKQMADHCPVFILQGTFSHEPPGFINVLGMIGAKHPIHISNSVEMVGLFDNQWMQFDPLDTTQPEFDLVVSSMPTVNKADLISLMPAETISSEMGNVVASVLASFGPQNTKLRNQGIPTVLVSHGTVSGSMNESGVPMAGPDHEFNLGALYSACTDAVLLGHIHLMQMWEREFNGVHQMIAYPGSPGRYHYGEIGEKYCLKWTVAANGVSVQKFVTPSRKMIDLEFTGVPDLTELQRIAGECQDAYVRVKFEVDEEYLKSVDRKAIKEILGVAAEVKIESSVLTIQRQRCPGISKLPSILERFMKWCELTETPKDGLSDRLTMLMNEDAKIVAETVATSK